MHLEDQRLYMDVLKSVSRARPQLAIIEGDTDGDGIAAQMVIARPGGGSINVWMGGAKVDDSYSDDDLDELDDLEDRYWQAWQAERG